MLEDAGGDLWTVQKVQTADQYLDLGMNHRHFIWFGPIEGCLFVGTAGRQIWEYPVKRGWIG